MDVTVNLLHNAEQGVIDAEIDGPTLKWPLCDCCKIDLKMAPTVGRICKRTILGWKGRCHNENNLDKPEIADQPSGKCILRTCGRDYHAEVMSHSRMCCMQQDAELPLSYDTESSDNNLKLLPTN